MSNPLIAAADSALRTLFATHRSTAPRPTPVTPTPELSAEEKALSGALMRVNHVGEVCAQALYSAQALAARLGRSPDREALARQLEAAGHEETDHLAWTEERMRTKKGDATVGSEAEEILSYLESKEWALVVVLLGEGQEINDGEAGIITWLEAVQNRAIRSNRVWRISTPDIDPELFNSFPVEVDPGLRLKVVRRTDNAADVSSWAAKLLDLKIEECKALRQDFPAFPIVVTRSIEKCRSWLRESVSNNPAC
jgi:hypothetical protein